MDALGTLHHVILRGIEKGKIVDDDNDRQNFVTRMAKEAKDTGTSIYAWALMNEWPDWTKIGKENLVQTI